MRRLTFDAALPARLQAENSLHHQAVVFINLYGRAMLSESHPNVAPVRMVPQDFSRRSAVYSRDAAASLKFQHSLTTAS
jgi:hypothetical protein